MGQTLQPRSSGTIFIRLSVPPFQLPGVSENFRPDYSSLPSFFLMLLMIIKSILFQPVCQAARPNFQGAQRGDFRDFKDITASSAIY